MKERRPREAARRRRTLLPSMKRGWFITLEGTEGCGKSTQIRRLADRLQSLGHAVRLLREPGGTPIGEEIRHTLQHSRQNHAMTPEAELLLHSASRAQLVREVIRPALAAGEIVLCDRFLDSTMAYQGYGRGLDLNAVRTLAGFAVGETLPDLTFLLSIPVAVSEARRLVRQAGSGSKGGGPVRDRMEEADRAFFERVESGYREVAAASPERIWVIDATQSIGAVADEIRTRTERLLRGARR
jgi:dTMP kinase